MARKTAPSLTQSDIEARPVERPNVLLIITDQHRHDAIGLDPLSPDALQTQNLDWYASHGALFQRGYSETPSCIPARRSIMSGMAPAAHGVVGGKDVEWDPPHTLAGELSKAGYQTEMIGKMHFSPRRKRYGFEHVQLADGNTGPDNDYVEWLRARHGRMEMDAGKAQGMDSGGWGGRPSILPEEQMHSFWVVDRAMDFLTRRDPSTPFFLTLSFIDPHPPFAPPKFYYDRYMSRDLPEPFVGDWAAVYDSPQRGIHPGYWEISLPEHDLRTTRAAYYGMVNFVDDQIGRLNQFVRDLMDDVLIVMTSDHGEMLGDHQRLKKTFPYEPSARVPFIIRPPLSWGLPAGLTPKGPVGLQDIMPTILDAVGLEIPGSCTGRSLMPVARGDVDRVRDVLHGEHSGNYDNNLAHQYLTDGRHKYVWFTQTGREHLFDLDEDPRELHDLALDSTAEARLRPWRERMAAVLDGRPEGFVEGGKLVVGRPHDHVIPGYEPNKTFPFV